MPTKAVCGDGGGKSGVGGCVYPVGVSGIPSVCLLLPNSKDPGGFIPLSKVEKCNPPDAIY